MGVLSGNDFVTAFGCPKSIPALAALQFDQEKY